LKGERKSCEFGWKMGLNTHGLLKEWGNQVAAVGRTTAELEVLGMKFKGQKINR
jgi:hypothetical protein